MSASREPASTIAARALWGAVLAANVAAWAGAAEAQASDPLDASPGVAQTIGENGGSGPAIRVMVSYVGDTLADVSGGVRRGSIVEGRLGVVFDANLEDLIGAQGLTAHASLHAIHGSGLSTHDVGNLLTVSGLEAEPAVRLFNLWMEQRLSAHAALRFGQFTAAQEFMVSSTASLLVNSTFGWPDSFATDLPSGGPAWPLAAPGVRLVPEPRPSVTLLAAAFAGDPAGPGSGDPQRRDRGGLNGWRVHGPPFVIVEGQRVLGPAEGGAVLKLGGWAHLDRFDDLRLDRSGHSLAAAEAGPPLRHSGDWAAYTVLDAPIWRSSSLTGRAVRGFVRANVSPSDRNRVDRYVDAGLSLSAPFAWRPQDLLGVGVAWARISPDARSLAVERDALNGAHGPRLDDEAVIELTYQAQFRPRVSIQPDLQYVIHPNGHAASPANPDRAIQNAWVIGVRASASF